MTISKEKEELVGKLIRLVKTNVKDAIRDDFFGIVMHANKIEKIPELIAYIENNHIDNCHAIYTWILENGGDKLGEKPFKGFPGQS